MARCKEGIYHSLQHAHDGRRCTIVSRVRVTDETLPDCALRESSSGIIAAIICARTVTPSANLTSRVGLKVFFVCPDAWLVECAWV